MDVARESPWSGQPASVRRQHISQRRIELETRERDCAEAQTALDLAATAWRQARNKLNAVDEMKQGWLREMRSRVELREEHSLEELSLRQIPLR